MKTLILTLHVVICFALVLLVLLQSGKEGMGVIFGGGSSSLFGSSGAGGVLAKLTAFVAIIFVLTSLGYNIATTERVTQKSIVSEDINIEQITPKAPAPPTPAPETAAPATAAPAAAPQSTAP